MGGIISLELIQLVKKFLLYFCNFLDEFCNLMKKSKLLVVDGAVLPVTITCNDLPTLKFKYKKQNRKTT